MKGNKIINEKLPIQKVGILGIQHVLVMYSGAVIVPLIFGGAIGLDSAQMAYLIAADLFTCGIATLLQVCGVYNFAGIKLPVMLGSTLMTLPVMISLAKSDGITTVFGSILLSGLFIILFSYLFIDKIIKFFPPVVTGTLVTIVGFSLSKIAVQDIAGQSISDPNFGNPKNFLLALIVLVTIFSVNKYAKGFIKSIAVLVGLLIGTLAGYFLGMVDLTPVFTAKWFQVITPFYFGIPKFQLNGTLVMCLVMTIAIVESMGIFKLIADMCEEELDSTDIAKGIRAEGIAQILGGIFNSFPYVTFSENAGLMGITGVRSRYPIMAAGVLLILIALVPKFAAIATIIPAPVLGAVMLVIFGMIGIAGIKMLSQVDLSNDSNNLIIAAAGISIGIGVSVVPDIFIKFPQIVQLTLGNGIFIGTVVALILNLFFNYKETIKVNSTKNNLTH